MVPLPPYYFEVIMVNGVVGFGCCDDDWVRGPSGAGGFPNVFIITGEVLTLIPIDGITLGDHGVFILRGDQEVLDGAATFEVSLDPIPTTDLFDAFTKTLCIRYYYVTICSRYIKYSIFIGVNNPTLNNYKGKFNLPHIWDRVLINTPGLKLNK